MKIVMSINLVTTNIFLIMIIDLYCTMLKKYNLYFVTLKLQIFL